VRPGCDADHSPPSSAAVKEEYLHPPSGPHRACKGITLPLPFLLQRKGFKSLKLSRLFVTYNIYKKGKFKPDINLNFFTRNVLEIRYLYKPYRIIGL